MTIENFAKQLLGYLQKYGTDTKRNQFLADLQALGKDLPQLYSVVNVKYLDNYVDGRNKGRIACNDPKLLTSRDFWNQPDQNSFMYVSKVLPELKKKYPSEYKEIFDGNNITKPAGYYPKGSEKRADVNADTIWNFISKIEGPEKEEKSSGGGTISRLRLNTFLNVGDTAFKAAKNYLADNQGVFGDISTSKVNKLNQYIKYVLDRI